jgi:hypothetical protein
MLMFISMLADSAWQNWWFAILNALPVIYPAYKTLVILNGIRIVLAKMSSDVLQLILKKHQINPYQRPDRLEPQRQAIKHKYTARSVWHAFIGWPTLYDPVAGLTGRGGWLFFLRRLSNDQV